MFKHIHYLFIPLFALFVGSFAIDPGNENIIKTYPQKEIGNGVTLNQIFNNFDGKNVCRGFRIKVKEDGEFFVSAWAEGLVETTWKVYVDGSPFEAGCLGLQKDGWQAGKIGHSNDKKTPRTLKLASGEHTIVFSGKGPDYPDVESLKFGKTEDEAFIDEEPFRKNIEKIMNNTDGLATLPGYNATSLQTAAAATPLVAPDEPYYDYEYRYGAFVYTFRKTFNFSSGASVKFEVKNATKPYILYFFKKSGTEMFTYVVTSPSGSNKSITKTIPFSGDYIVMIRAYTPSNPGTCNLYYNNNLNASGCIVAGNVFWGSLTKTGTLNYFAASTEEGGYENDSYIYLVTDINYPVATFNDDFGQPGDFNWGYLSRKQFDFAGWTNPNNTVGFIASTYWSGDYFDRDCYMMNSNETTILSQFENLKAVDAINSSYSTGNYNCFAWSGGVTAWAIPAFPTVVDAKAYYKNMHPTYVRYAGAEEFTIDGATKENAVIDLWSKPSGYTHATVRRYSNGHVHGYDWESKIGRDTRFLHPRFAIRGNLYGDTVPDDLTHWISCGFSSTAKMEAMGINRPLTMSESVELGFTRIHKISFTSEETLKLASQSKKIHKSVQVAFSEKYRKWERTWAEPPLCFSSDNRDYAQSDEYQDFLNFCREKGKTVWPLLFTLLNAENIYNISILMETLFYPEYKGVMDAIQNRNIAGRYDDDGTVVMYSPEGNWREFCRAVLKREL